MNVFGKIKQILQSDEWDDQSKVLAKEWERLLKESNELKNLSQNPGFKQILEGMKSDFKVRMQIVIKDDPELRSIRNMFIRTVGMTGAEETIDKMLDEVLDKPIVLSKK